MNFIKCIACHYKCSGCHQVKNFTDTVNSCSVKRFQCNHFNILFIKTNDGRFKLKITFICNQCNTIKNVNLKLGKKSQGNTLITDDSYYHFCCGNNIELTAFLSEEMIENNYNNMSDFNNSFEINYFNDNNNNNIINNHNSNNNNNNIVKNKNSEINKNYEYQSYNLRNIIEFNEKNKMVNFLDERTNKTYKIYTKDEIILKNLLEDLGSQFPEINYKNKRLMVDGRSIVPESTIRNCNLNEQSVIIIKKTIN